MKKNYWRIMIGFIAIITISLAALSWNEPETSRKTIPTPKIVLRAIHKNNIIASVKNAVAQLEQATFNQMVPNKIIAKAFEESRFSKAENLYNGTTFWSMNFYARHAVFDEYLRKPFEDENEFYNALYAAYSGGEWYYRDADLPLEIDGPLNKARKLIMNKARNHLKKPTNLWSFYQAKKELIIGLINEKDLSQQNNLLNQLNITKSAFEIFESEEFQFAYKNYIEARKKWWKELIAEDTARKAYNEATNNLIKGIERDDEFYKQVTMRSWIISNGRRSKVTVAIPEDRKELYRIFEEKELEFDSADRTSMATCNRIDRARGGMDTLSPNIWSSLFAGRRFSEGGSELIKVYIQITDDLIKTLERIRAFETPTTLS